MTTNREGGVSLSEQLDVFVRSLSHLQSQLKQSQLKQSQLKRQLQAPSEDPIQTVLSSDATDNNVATDNATDINQSVVQLQHQFQAILSTAGDFDIDLETDQSSGQSFSQSFMTYQTEAHRRLRLMAVESMRLRTARQLQTVERICNQLNVHLTQVQQFAQAMMREVDEG